MEKNFMEILYILIDKSFERYMMLFDKLKQLSENNGDTFQVIILLLLCRFERKKFEFYAKLYKKIIGIWNRF